MMNKQESSSSVIPIIPDSVHRMWPELDGLGFSVKSSPLGGYVQISPPKSARERIASRSAMKSAAQSPRDLEESSRRTVPVITKSSKQMFAELDGIELRMRPSSLDWTDERMSQLAHVNIQVYPELDAQQRTKVLLSGIQSLYLQVTAQSVANLLMAAWGLVSPQNKQVYLFPKVAMNGPCVDVTELEHRVLVSYEGNHGTCLPFPQLWSPHEWNAFERTAAYMCAATLRLVTKDEGSLHRSWKSLMRNYRNFYHEEPAFELTPNLDCLKGIRNFLQARRHLKGTIACFLLGFLELEGQGQRLCRTLFETDMAYTGMHSYRLLMSVTEKVEAPLSEVIKVVKHPSFVQALRTIVHIVLKYELPQTVADKERAMGARTWKYARIFDSDLFADIQTKNCMMLVSVLATIAQKLGVGGDATKIHGISGYLTNRREEYEKRADVFISIFKSGA